MSVITTSLVVDFDPGDTGGILKAEIDARPSGYNSGLTSFVPGDSPVFLLYKTTNVTITAIETSVGSVVNIGTGIRALGDAGEEEYITFANTREGTPAYPIFSGFTSKWLGIAGGIVTNTENKITVPTPVVAALKIGYNAQFTAYRLTGVPLLLDGESKFPVVIYISGVAI